MKRILLALAALLAMASASYAINGNFTLSSNTSLLVTATVGSTCTVSAPGLNFGNVNNGNFTPTPGSVFVNCSTSFSQFEVTMDGGQNQGKAGGFRDMTDGLSHYIDYGIWVPNFPAGVEWGDTDQANTSVFGAGITGNTGKLSTATINYTAFASTSGTVPPGLYTDTVLVTVYF